MKAAGLEMGYRQYVGLQEKHWFNSAAMDEEDYFRFFCKKTGAPAGSEMVARLAGIWRKQRDAVKIFPETAGTLRELGKKYPLAIVSNTEPGSEAVEKRLGLGRFFDSIIHSCDAGVLKPRRGIFLKATKAVGAKPAECVMVGNDAEDDVLGAKNAGLKTVWLNRRAKADALGRAADAEIHSLEELVSLRIL